MVVGKHGPVRGLVVFIPPGWHWKYTARFFSIGAALPLSFRFVLRFHMQALLLLFSGAGVGAAGTVCKCTEGKAVKNVNRIPEPRVDSLWYLENATHLVQICVLMVAI